jgi:hypothetical protein
MLIFLVLRRYDTYFSKRSQHSPTSRNPGRIGMEPNYSPAGGMGKRLGNICFHPVLFSYPDDCAPGSPDPARAEPPVHPSTAVRDRRI